MNFKFSLLLQIQMNLLPDMQSWCDVTFIHTQTAACKLKICVCVPSGCLHTHTHTHMHTIYAHRHTMTHTHWGNDACIISRVHNKPLPISLPPPTLSFPQGSTWFLDHSHTQSWTCTTLFWWGETILRRRLGNLFTLMHKYIFGGWQFRWKSADHGSGESI